jgi:hypothetical protein
MHQKRMCTSPLPQYNILHLEVYIECTAQQSSCFCSCCSIVFVGRNRISVHVVLEENAHRSDLPSDLF